MPGTLSFQLLGPVTATYDSQPLDLGGPKPRAVLAALLYGQSRPYPTEDLLRDVWGRRGVDDGGTGPSPDAVFQYIARIRRTLAVAGGQVRIDANRHRGYQIVIPAGSVDWLRHQALVTHARAAQHTDPAAALEQIRQAVGLWHGPPLADLGPEALTVMRAEMTAHHAGATELWAELELDHGRPAAVIDPLCRLAAEHPDREHTATLLVRTLRLTGRRGEATAVYQRTIRHLIEQFGIDPAAELHREYTRLETVEPSAARRAADAGIRAVDHFFGRDHELDHLATLLSNPGDGPGAVVICAVDGMPGVGKTELARHLIYRIADHYPDGIHEIDLHGWSPGYDPIDSAEALDRLLRRLGVPGPSIPASLEERAALYRRKLADQRSLILLDNARNSAQVHPLLPATPGCRVIVTGRRRFTALDEAHTLHLDVLEPDDAVALFIRVADLPAGANDLEVVPDVVARCGHLPLAVRVLAARYRQHAWHTLTALAQEMEDAQARLGLMDDDQRSVTAAFTISHHSLPTDQQRLFTLLGLLPGPTPTTTAHSAAALADTTTSTAGHLLARLAEANLLAQPHPGRYGLHDLIRDYTRTRAAALPEADRHTALSRLCDHYAHTASIAMNLAHPYETHQRPGPPAVSTPQSLLTEPEQALAWLDAETDNLLAVAQHAPAHGLVDHLLHQSATLHRHLRTRGRYTDADTLHTSALHHAKDTDNSTGEQDALIG